MLDERMPVPDTRQKQRRGRAGTGRQLVDGGDNDLIFAP